MRFSPTPKFTFTFLFRLKQVTLIQVRVRRRARPPSRTHTHALRHARTPSVTHAHARPPSRTLAHARPPSRTPSVTHARQPLSASSPPRSPPGPGPPSRCPGSLLQRSCQAFPSKTPSPGGAPSALTPLAPASSYARKPKLCRSPRQAHPPDSQTLEPVSSDSREHTVPREGGQTSG